MIRFLPASYPSKFQVRPSRSLSSHNSKQACHFDRRGGRFCRPGAEKSLFNFEVQASRGLKDDGPVVDCSSLLTELFSISFPIFFSQRIPRLRNVPHTFQLALHLCVFGFHHFGTCVRRNINRPRKQDHRARKRHWQEKMIPRVCERLPAIHSNVEHHHRAARLSCQHHRPGLGHVARPARAVNRKRAIQAFIQPPRHHRQPAQPSS